LLFLPKHANLDLTKYLFSCLGRGLAGSGFLINKLPTQGMSTKLFVGGIPFESTDDQLREPFANIGEVLSARIITDKFTGRSRGFGFVEMASDEDAQKAIQTLNGSDMNGRKIAVSEARPMRDDR